MAFPDWLWAGGRWRGESCRWGGLAGRGGAAPHPQLARAEVAEDGGHAAHVVGVRVGEGDDVEAAELARPEVGRNDLLADVEGGVICTQAAGVFGVGGGAGGASRVDEHDAAGGADDEQRVTLADVDRGDFERVGMDDGRRRPEG